MGKIIVVNFEQGRTEASAYDKVWQYDYGQTLRIQGLKLPRNVEIHFATQRTGGIAIPRVGVTRDGVTDVVIPDSMLENGDATSDYPVYAFVYLTDETSGQTEYMIRMQVKSRPRPEVPGGSEDPGAFHEAVQEVRKLTERATESERQAEGWAHGREDLPERAQDNAKYYAEKASEDAKKTAADRTAVESVVQDVTQMQGDVARDLEQVQKLTGQAQTSATNAALSEQAAKTSETNAQTAQAGAETAEANAELAEQGAKTSEQAVEKAKQLVTQMGQEVLDNKNHVDQVVHDFDLTTQQALADVNNAGQTQTERVQSAGEVAVESVKTAQNTATQAVETAKTEAVESVQTEGTAQTGNVTKEGEKQVQAVQAVAQEIVADRQQIQKNKEDIESLGHNKADAIIETSNGENITLTDSAEAPLRGLRIFGKSTQVQTKGYQLFDASKILTKSAGGATITNNGDGSFTISGSGNLTDSIASYYTYKHEEFKKIFKAGKVQFNIESTDSHPYCYMHLLNNNSVIMDSAKKNIEISQDMINDPNYTVRIGFYGCIDGNIIENTIKPMAYQDGDGTFEPFTNGKPSPAPENPSPIVSMGNKGTVEVEITGTNLFDVSKIEDTWNGSHGIKNNNGVLTMVASPNDSTIATGKMLKELCPWVKVGGTYVFNAINSGTRNAIYLYRVGVFEYGKPIVITDEMLNSELRLYISNKANDSGTIQNIQVNRGDTTLPYEPYREPQPLAISTPNGLPGIRVNKDGNYTDSNGQQWICDEIDLARGKYVQRIEKITLDGSQELSTEINNNAARRCFTYSTPKRALAYRTVTSTHFKTMEFGYNKPSGNNTISFDSSRNIIMISTDKFASVEEFKNWLNENNVIVVYALETPIEHDLTPEEITAYKALHTNYPTTVISNDESAHMKVSYVADTKNYIAKVNEPLQKQITELQNALISQKISGGGYKGI